MGKSPQKPNPIHYRFTSVGWPGPALRLMTRRPPFQIRVGLNVLFYKVNTVSPVKQQYGRHGRNIDLRLGRMKIDIIISSCRCLQSKFKSKRSRGPRVNVDPLDPLFTWNGVRLGAILQSNNHTNE